MTKRETYFKIIIVLLAVGLIAVLIQNQMIIGKITELNLKGNGETAGNEETKETNTGEKETEKETPSGEEIQTNPFQEVIDKLLLHPEIENYNGRMAIITPLNEENLPELKEKYPNIYSDSKAGDYVFEYSDLLVVYDYKNDSIVKIFNIQNINISAEQ